MPEISQEIYREKTFGAYPHVEEIKRLHSREKYSVAERWGPNLGILTPRKEYVAQSVELPPLRSSQGNFRGFSSARFQKPKQKKPSQVRRSTTCISQQHKENFNTHFRMSTNIRNKYHFICPEWLSEGISYRRLYKEQKSDPFRYGWA